jgi:predicted transcriptional regulator
LRVEELIEEPEEDEDKVSKVESKEQAKKRLYGKQKPPKAYLKGLKIDEQEEDDLDENEVTKTISLLEVYQELDLWIPGMKSELDS